MAFFKHKELWSPTWGFVPSLCNNIWVGDKRGLWPQQRPSAVLDGRVPASAPAPGGGTGAGGAAAAAAGAEATQTLQNPPPDPHTGLLSSDHQVFSSFTELCLLNTKWDRRPFLRTCGGSREDGNYRVRPCSGFFYKLIFLYPELDYKNKIADRADFGIFMDAVVQCSSLHTSSHC